MQYKALGSGAVLGTLFAALALAATAEGAESPSALLEKGIYTEETVGDLPKAIEIYQKVVVEAKSVEPYAAKAQYRLGQCLLKQKKNDEAEAAFKKLIETYPDQKDWVAKAKKHLPGQAELTLGEIPWKDGEFMQLGITLGGGMKIGTFVWSVESAKLDGRDIWRMNTHRFVLAGGDNKGISHVYVDKNTFRPIRSTFQHTLLGDTDADYMPDEVVVTMHTKGKTSTRKEKLDKTYYDNEQGVELFRRLPLTEGYKAITPIYASFGGGKIPIEVEVTAKETVEVPAGKFECYKLHLGLVNQDFWFSTDANRYFVKMEAGGVTGELEQIGLNKPDGMKTYNDKEWGFSFSAPAGWYFYASDKPEKDDSRDFYLLDPEERATNFVGVWKVKNDKAKDDKAGTKKSARAFAEEAVAARIRELKDYKIRPDSWKEFTVGGLPAVSVIGDYVLVQQKKTDYSVHVLGQTTKAQLRVSSCAPRNSTASAPSLTRSWTRSKSNEDVNRWAYSKRAWAATLGCGPCFHHY